MRRLLGTQYKTVAHPCITLHSESETKPYKSRSQLKVNHDLASYQNGLKRLGRGSS